jgi:uncharacterized protein (TIGR02145 family)
MTRLVLIFTGILLTFSLVKGQNLTNIGTDFWIAFPPNNSSTATLHIFISSEYATSGTVSSAFPGVNQSFTVTPGVVSEVVIPSGARLTPGTEDKGIRITALDPVAVYGLNFVLASTDAFLALPVSSLGTDYMVLTYKTTVSNKGSSFSVVAIQDGTVLNIFNKQTGSTYDITLNYGQTYHETATTLGHDLTGSTIHSNQPVSVFGSVDLTFVPSGCSFGDHIVEQLFPVTAWGKRFITVPLAGRDNSGDIFRILAREDNTQVSINEMVVATLNTGDYHEVNLAGFNSITTSKSVLVAQYAKGTQCSGNTIGDPFMMLIQPREQFLTSYTICTVAGFTSHWVNIVAPSYAVGTILMDGIPIPAASFVAVGTTSYQGAQVPISEGSHTFTSTIPFGVFVYGWTNVNSYGYPGGGSLSPVGTVSSVTLSPSGASGILNVSTVCLTAHVDDDLSNPVAGVLVTFNVSGLNPLTGTGYTNSLGDAQFCYTQTGTVSTTDLVQAEIFGFTSTTSTVDWSYLPPPCINPTDGGTVGEPQTGCDPFLPSPITSITPATGYTGTLEYKWQISTAGPSSGFINIPGSNSANLSPGALSQTSWFRRLARVDCMPGWDGTVPSNVIEITVDPINVVSVTIAASENPFCQGTPVTFTGIIMNGGTNPGIAWKVNGITRSTGAINWSYFPADNDLVSCVVTSDLTCPLPNPATSNTIVMAEIPTVASSITITPSKNPFCTGETVIFNAAAFNGGSNPQYDWKVNGMSAYAGGNQFSYQPMAGDQVSCVLTSTMPCLVANPVVSNLVVMQPLPVPVITFTACFDTMTTTNAKPFALKGGLPRGGVYTGTGVNTATSQFNPTLAGSGVHDITYTFSNIYGCQASIETRIHVLASQPFVCGSILTDVRDGKTYRTFSLPSGKCWMQENLAYGSALSDRIPQTDNCVPEQYNCQLSIINCQLALYQWDELMQYQTGEGAQGLCPSGWHVPQSAEWEQLIAWSGGVGSAGGPMKDTLVTGGFHALQAGFLYLNHTWAFTSGLTAGSMFWTSTLHDSERAVARGINEAIPSVSKYRAARSNAFSVRCLRDQ